MPHAPPQPHAKHVLTQRFVHRSTAEAYLSADELWHALPSAPKLHNPSVLAGGLGLTKGGEMWSDHRGREVPLGADAVEHLQQHRAFEFLWCNVQAPTLDASLAHLRELFVHLRQCLDDPLVNPAQGMRFGHEVLKMGRRKLRFIVGGGASHRGLATPCSMIRPSTKTRGLSIGISTGSKGSRL